MVAVAGVSVAGTTVGSIVGSSVSTAVGSAVGRRVAVPVAVAGGRRVAVAGSDVLVGRGVLVAVGGTGGGAVGCCVLITMTGGDVSVTACVGGNGCAVGSARRALAVRNATTPAQ